MYKHLIAYLVLIILVISSLFLFINTRDKLKQEEDKVKRKEFALGVITDLAIINNTITDKAINDKQEENTNANKVKTEIKYIISKDACYNTTVPSDAIIRMQEYRNRVHTNK